MPGTFFRFSGITNRIENKKKPLILSNPHSNDKRKRKKKNFRRCHPSIHPSYHPFCWKNFYFLFLFLLPPPSLPPFSSPSPLTKTTHPRTNRSVKKKDSCECKRTTRTGKKKDTLKKHIRVIIT